MLIHPWDAALGTAEWQDWLASTDRFGMLAVNNLDHDKAPIVLPLHFTVAGDALLLHLARPNPVWPHLEAAAEVRLAVTGDYAYIPTYWRAKAGGPDEDGVPTSYYSSVQFVCRPTVVDDPRPRRKSSLPSSPTSSPKADTPRLVSTPRPTGGCFPASAVSGLRCCESTPSSNTTMPIPSSTVNAS
jgi:predicted FMN-binding regulatory protein PaiB